MDYVERKLWFDRDIFHALRIKALLLLPILALELSGCAGNKPDLKRIYDVTSADYFQNPVVLVHGAFGAKLRTVEGKKTIWPGNILFDRYESIALDIDPKTLAPRDNGTEAYSLFEQFAGSDYYGRILNTLEEVGRYTKGRLGEKNIGSRRYYAFVYDWRQDMVKTAGKLDSMINHIRKDYDQPELKVDVIAHSIGAPLLRYYVRFGGEDVLDDKEFRPNYIGGSKIRKAILIGAPNLGSVSALQNFMKGYRVGLGSVTTEVFATMPVTYQILPDPDRDWMITPDGKKFTRDLYSVQTWRDYEWSIFDPDIRARTIRRFSDPDEGQRYLATLERYFEKHLARGRNFHRALSAPIRRSPVRYVLFGGDCLLTPARCLVENVGGKTVIRLFPQEITNRVEGVDYHKLMLEPGDGRVTKPSLLARNSLDPSVPGRSSDVFPAAYSVFLCEVHSRLTGNLSFQDNLLNILLLQETTEDRIKQSMRNGNAGPAP